MAKTPVQVTSIELEEQPVRGPTWIRDGDPHDLGVRTAPSVPWLGFCMLAGSALTMILSLLVLVMVDDKVVWTGKVASVIKPASCLSALLSANSICLHGSLVEGVTIAWWWNAARQDSTVADLHNLWSFGTSLSSALQGSRKLNYVSLATLFVALIPLNGFLLQGAISTLPASQKTLVNVTVPMVQSMPLGYSAVIGDNGILDLSGGFWGLVWQQFTNIAMIRNPQYYYFGTITSSNGYNGALDFGCDNSSVCSTRAAGVGFSANCTKTRLPYDLLPVAVNDTRHARIFETAVTWDNQGPNTILLDVLWKGDSSCTGVYEVRNCELHAATVEYPVQLQMNDSSAYLGPYFSLPEGTTRNDDKMIELLAPYSDEGVANSTYGGVALTLGNFYNSTYEITSNYDGGGSANTTGHLALSLMPGLNISAASNSDYSGECNTTFNYGFVNMQFLSSLDDPVVNPATAADNTSSTVSIDLSDMILEQIRKAMFMASVDRGSSWYSANRSSDLRDSYMQEVPATQLRPVVIYRVRYYLWGASVALTHLIIIFILPTFWGFWMLARKPTLSPVDMARAFNAPVLTEYRVDAESLLHEVGNRRIHQDLAFTTPESFLVHPFASVLVERVQVGLK